MKYVLLAIMLSLSGISAIIVVKAETIQQLATALLPSALAVLTALVADSSEV